MNVPMGYQIGEKERNYLRELEQFRREGVPLTPTDFCREVGLAGSSSIRRYRVLKAALNEYGWRTAPDRMRGPQASLLAAVDLGSDPQIAALEEKVGRLESELHKKENLRTELQLREAEVNSLKGILMSFVAHFSRDDVHRARDIESVLFALLREHLPEGAVPDIVLGDSATEDAIRKLLDDVRRRR